MRGIGRFDGRDSVIGPSAALGLPARIQGGPIAMATVRRATASWSGDLLSGSGTVSAYSSGLFSELPVSWASRTEMPEGRTSPEELLAAAHAACYCMAFSGKLATAKAM